MWKWKRMFLIKASLTCPNAELADLVANLRANKRYLMEKNVIAFYTAKRLKMR